MTDLGDLNKDTPRAQNDTVDSQHEADLAHRRMEREAMKGAQRAGKREYEDEKGNDEFKNIGPV
jgi:hypothetical protein